MSAFFVDKDNNVVTAEDAKDRTLYIKGTVHKNGQPVKTGNVRLAVTTEDGQFEQTVSAPLKDGNFESKDPAFSSLRPDDPIQIAAQVSSSEFKEVRDHEIFLNMTQPSIGRTTKFLLWIMLGFFPLLLLGVFFGAFTGTKTPTKNRVAIILSYCIIGLFLAIPLLAPVLLLHAFPEARENMIGAPVGLVVTQVRKPTPGEPQDDQTQWAVNIGGFSKRVTPTPTPAVSETPAGTEQTTATESAGSDNSDTAGGSETPASQPSPSPEASSSPSVEAQQSRRQRRRQVNQIRVRSATSPTTTPQAAAVAATPSRKPNENDYLVSVTGGLVIPLYVIILSVIGGAINMTRKVPRYQREGEFSELATPGLSPKKLWASAMKVWPSSKNRDAVAAAAKTILEPEVAGAGAAAAVAGADGESASDCSRRSKKDSRGAKKEGSRRGK